MSFVYIADVNHTKSKRLMHHLIGSQSTLLFPTTAICEAVTVLRGRLNRPDDAARIMQKFHSGDFPVQAVDEEVLRHAAGLYRPQVSKNTLFDAVIAAIAQKLHADAIFSFDGWYRKIELTLVSDFIEQEKAA